jgi:hypothetical protein
VAGEMESLDAAGNRKFILAFQDRRAAGRALLRGSADGAMVVRLLNPVEYTRFRVI